MNEKTLFLSYCSMCLFVMQLSQIVPDLIRNRQADVRRVLKKAEGLVAKAEANHRALLNAPGRC